MRLLQQFQMHLRAAGGSTYGHLIMDADAGNRLIGHKSSWIPTGKNPKGLKPWTVLTLMSRGDQKFNDLGSFKSAYEQQLRDEEFDAAEPKRGKV